MGNEFFKAVKAQVSTSTSAIYSVKFEAIAVNIASLYYLLTA